MVQAKSEIGLGNRSSWALKYGRLEIEFFFGVVGLAVAPWARGYPCGLEPAACRTGFAFVLGSCRLIERFVLQQFALSLCQCIAESGRVEHKAANNCFGMPGEVCGTIGGKFEHGSLHLFGHCLLSEEYPALAVEVTLACAETIEFEHFLFVHVQRHCRALAYLQFFVEDQQVGSLLNWKLDRVFRAAIRAFLLPKEKKRAKDVRVFFFLG